MNFPEFPNELAIKSGQLQDQRLAMASTPGPSLRQRRPPQRSTAENEARPNLDSQAMRFLIPDDPKMIPAEFCEFMIV